MKQRLCFFVLFILSVHLAYCQESSLPAEKLKTVVGTVVQKDWVGSVITVKSSYTDESSPNDEITIVVPDTVRILRGTDQIQLTDINESDDVVVTYFDSGFTGLKAVSIQDKNLANE
jgi:hypothetical protein